MYRTTRQRRLTSLIMAAVAAETGLAVMACCEAIVAMEQLAAAEGLPELMKQARKEKDQKVLGSLWRAIGACGAKDAKARGALLKAAKGKDEFARRSALIGLGWSEPNEDVQKCLAAALAGTDGVDGAAGTELVSDALLLPATFTGKYHLTGGHECFTSHFAGRIESQEMVDQGVADLVGDLVGVAFADGLGGEEIGHGFDYQGCKGSSSLWIDKIKGWLISTRERWYWG